MKRHLSVVWSIALLGCTCLTGCSQTYSYSDKDGYTCDYPLLGQDISGLVQDILNREGDPTTNHYATNGAVTFRVLKAKVVKADDVVPSPDFTQTVILFHGQIAMSLPNGQTVECEDLEVLHGRWEHAKICDLDVDSALAAGALAPDVLQPSGLARLKASMDAARTRAEMQAAIEDVTSIKDLFKFLCGRDLVHQKYDFTCWQEANRLGMAHADEIFCGNGDSLPLDLAPAPVQAVAPVPPPAIPVKPLLDRYTLFLAPGVIYNVPIYDRSWFNYKASLLAPRFDQKAWAALAATLPRIELENRMHDALAAALQEEEEHEAERGPYGGSLVKVAYANQPAVARSRSVMALRILVDAIADDVNSKRNLP